MKRWARIVLALIVFLGVIPARHAHAQVAVIDVAAIAESLKDYVIQVEQLATDVKIWVQEELSWTTQLQELEQEIQTVVHLATLVENFIHDPNIYTAMGLLNLAGLNLDMPVNPYIVMALLNGSWNTGSLSSLTGELSLLNGLISTSWANHKIYNCESESFGCKQSQRRSAANAATKGTLARLYESLTEHNEGLNALKEDANNAPDPKTQMDVQSLAIIQGVWHTSVAAQIEAVKGIADAEVRIDAAQANEKWRMDAKAFRDAVPD